MEVEKFSEVIAAVRKIASEHDYGAYHDVIMSFLDLEHETNEDRTRIVAGLRAIIRTTGKMPDELNYPCSHTNCSVRTLESCKECDAYFCGDHLMGCIKGTDCAGSSTSFCGDCFPNQDFRESYDEMAGQCEVCATTCNECGSSNQYIYKEENGVATCEDCMQKCSECGEITEDASFECEHQTLCSGCTSRAQRYGVGNECDDCSADRADWDDMMRHKHGEDFFGPY